MAPNLITDSVIMSAPMVRALLDGRKTQTRRLAEKNVDIKDEYGKVSGSKMAPTKWHRLHTKRESGARILLYVKERWQLCPECGLINFEADMHLRSNCTSCDAHIETWRTPLYLSKRASRLTLDVSATRVERLQRITERDALCEGMTFPEGMEYGSDPKNAYAGLWRRIHGEGSWTANPLVVVVTFESFCTNISTFASSLVDAA